MRTTSITLLLLALAAAGCESKPKPTTGGDDAKEPAAQTANAAADPAAATDTAGSKKADGPTTLAIRQPEPASICAEFDPNATPGVIPSKPADTDAPKMLVKFGSRDAVAGAFGGACTAPSTDAVDFDKHHVVYLRTESCNVYEDFEHFELGPEALTLVATLDPKEVLCMNLGHFWFLVPPLDRDVAVRAVN
jgi:hypothetical protein